MSFADEGLTGDLRDVEDGEEAVAEAMEESLNSHLTPGHVGELGSGHEDGLYILEGLVIHGKVVAGTGCHAIYSHTLHQPC